ncbi:TrbC family F-type conjugative pilus assembly protein [Aliidiomarina quisquiliarum]|uniref:TrbC family F-type conjugative pilus assembly protein n=1 Tax=Aliidiomarina quisquiliarum TaxID=2938947 RepID=UPI00208F8712|nr:TrbC family F-type conjugative pilus assembly protein [Aliidiomarina quisquiliarum]MCO4319948.1 TrbC family F-type conjugative pilus assembly protein [Aliidiomarina quisquiliarum]
MQFIKLAILLSMTAFIVDAQSQEQSNEEIAREIQRISEERARQLIESGMLDDIKPPSRRENRHQENAEALSTQSMLDMSAAMARYGFATEEQAAAFVEPTEYGQSDNLNTLEQRQMYVSFAMGESNLRAAIQSASRQNAAVFFNGLKPGARTIDDMMAAVHQVIEGMENIPNIRFNPYGFEYFNISKAPTIAYSNDGVTTLAAGITGFEWIEQRHGVESEHLGEHGPTVDVSERNLLDEIEERYNALDMEQKKEQAVAQFWHRQSFQDLPQSTENERWFIDPTVRVNQDITNPRGEVLAKAGTVVNPLRNAPMHNTYITFDATQEDQVAFVEKYLSENSFQGRVMLITSKINREEGWNHLQSLRDQFEREIYMLQKEMVTRFDIRALPTVITTDLERFVLRVEQFELGEPDL